MVDQTYTTLFEDQGEDANSDPVPLVFHSRSGVLVAFGDWDGATVTLEVSLDYNPDTETGTFVPLESHSLSDDGSFNFKVNSFGRPWVRAVIASAGSGTNLTVQLDLARV